MADIPLVEPIPVPDTYFTSIVRVEFLPGENMRFWFGVLQRGVDCGQESWEHVVVAKLVGSKNAVSTAAMIALVSADAQVFGETATH